jgi:hypothetical protein
LDVLENPLRSLALDLGIVRRERISSSSVLLKELRDIYALNTVEYIYRTVFPYDYMPETTSMDEIMEAIRNGEGPVDRILEPEQRLYFDAHNLAQEVGLGGDEFIVLTVRAFAGFDLDGTAFADAGRDPGGATAEPGRDPASRAAPYVSLENTEDGFRIAHVRIPRAAVTDIIIEDVDPDTYSYPDVGMDAEAWREVAEFVSEHVKERTIEEGILDTAASNARGLVETLLLSAGIDQVSFENEAKSSANSESRR